MLSQADLQFLKMARVTGQRSAFSKKKRGAILSKDNKVVAAGVSSHLNEGGATAKSGALSENERYVATVNAEVVAVGAAVKAGIFLSGCTIYVSDCPNWQTFKFLVTLGLKRILHYGPTTNDRITHYAREMGVEIIGIG